MTMKAYRVQRVTPEGEVVEEHEVRATSADGAAAAVVPGKLYRGNRGYRAILRAKVYALDSDGGVTLVRFYERMQEIDR